MATVKGQAVNKLFFLLLKKTKQKTTSNEISFYYFTQGLTRVALWKVMPSYLVGLIFNVLCYAL